MPGMCFSPFTLLSLHGLRGQKDVQDPGKSRLMSQHGSIVVETPWQAWRVTSDCRPPVKICEDLGLLATLPTSSPLQYLCRTSRAAMRNSWASCCLFPGKWQVCIHTRCSNLWGTWGDGFQEYNSQQTSYRLHISALNISLKHLLEKTPLNIDMLEKSVLSRCVDPP